jgi:hypothetical protein
VLIGMEACGGAHDWARRCREPHHEVKRHCQLNGRYPISCDFP